MRCSLIILCASICVLSLCPQLLAVDIVRNDGKFTPYYHFEFRLEQGNFTTTVPVEFINEQNGRMAKSEINDWGGFEVFVRKDRFPIKAPGCNSDYLILRMPQTLSDDRAGVVGKRELWESILKVEDGRAAGLGVVIELNPYMKVVSEEPLVIELEYCNVLFRAYEGEYVPYLGSIKATGDD